MGKAYVEHALRHLRAPLPAAVLRGLLRSGDPGAGPRGLRRIVGEVTRLSGATPEEVWQFFSHGMLLNVVASLHLRRSPTATLGRRLVRAQRPDRAVAEPRARRDRRAAAPTSTPTPRSRRPARCAGRPGRRSTGSWRAASTAASWPRSRRARPRRPPAGRCARSRCTSSRRPPSARSPSPPRSSARAAPTTAVSLRIEQEGRAVTLALATLGALPDDGPAWDAGGLPDAPPARRGRAGRRRAHDVAQFFRNYELRFALQGGPEGAPGTGGWIAHARAARARRPARGGDDRRLGARRLRRARRASSPRRRSTSRSTSAARSRRRAWRRSDFVLGRFWSRLGVAGVWEEDGELWTPGGELHRPVAPARARPGAAGVTRAGLPRARLQRRRPPRQPAGGGRRAAGARRRRCSPPRRPTTPSRSARCSTSPTSSTPASGSRPALEPEALLDACKAVERELGRRPAACATARGRSTSTCCCWATRRYRSERLSLPHEQVTSRRFVLVPLLELAPDLVVPGGGPAADALEALGRGRIRAPRRAAAAGGRRRRPRLALPV